MKAFPAGRRWAWVILAVSLTLSLAGVVIGALRTELNVDHAAFVVSFASVQVVGALLLAHQPRNAIGRVMVGLGLVVAVQAFVEGYAQPVGTPPEWPWGGVVLTWLVGHTYVFIFGAIGLLFLLFPTGQRSPRWRFVPWLMGAGFVLALSLYFAPGPLDDEAAGGFGNPDNPYGLDAYGEIFDAASTVGALLLLSGIACSVVALILRYRASEGVARLQMKWFASASACFAVVLAVNLVLRNFFTLPAWIDIVLSLTFALIPISIGNAILRYRLYEIDVFINRALVYTVLTACVAGAYLGLVVILQEVLDPVTGDSDLAVAASTLAVAALFRPLRARIQSFIDRRFYRRKYDAARAVSTFAMRLRNEIDLELVADDVVAVVGDTLQPTHVRLWMRTESLP
jgi:hypothetical protein